MNKEEQTEKKEEKTTPLKESQENQKRQIIIEFDVQQAKIINGQLASNFELIGILESLLEQIKPSK